MDCPAPAGTFASDNFSGIHPRYLDALRAANQGHLPAYGNDPHTREATELFRTLCDLEVDVLFTFGGTGANVVALGSLLQPGESVVCASTAHINVDETGAPEKILGVKLQDVPTEDGRVRPDDLSPLLHALGNVHHVQPGVLSITQATELGTTYRADDIRGLCDAAHEAGLRVHLDGARIANAVAAAGGDADAFRAMTFGAGVDAVSFGGTKNGMLHAEAVLLRPGLSSRAEFLRKQFTQLPSKMRFASAQFVEALRDGLWIATATNANTRAQELFDALCDIHSLGMKRPAVNSVYPFLSPENKTRLQDWSFFWDWDVSRGQVRWMTSWDSTTDDVAAFAAGVRSVVTGS
jgi:threonine aldolase